MLTELLTERFELKYPVLKELNYGKSTKFIRIGKLKKVKINQNKNV